MRTRRGAPADDARIREVAARAKAHWGYDRERVAAWAAGLDLSMLGDSDAEIYVAENRTRIVGWCALVARGEAVELDQLWVEPDHIGHGVGSRLFQLAIDRARELGASRLELEAEPNAVGFYEKLGARPIGEAVGSWGRPLPVLALDLRR